MIYTLFASHSVVFLAIVQSSFSYAFNGSMWTRGHLACDGCRIEDKFDLFAYMPATLPPPTHHLYLVDSHVSQESAARTLEQTLETNAFSATESQG